MKLEKKHKKICIRTHNRSAKKKTQRRWWNTLLQEWFSNPLFKNFSLDHDEHLHGRLILISLDTTWYGSSKECRIYTSPKRKDDSSSRENSKWCKGRTRGNHTYDNEQFNIWKGKQTRNQINWNVKMEWGKRWLNTPPSILEIFKDEWMRIHHLRRLLKIRIKEKSKHNSSSVTISQRNYIHSTSCILQWKSLLFIVMKFGQAKSLKR